MKRKTPQEKKQESYEKDRRNTYGESGARSRFAIARRRRNRASRARAAARQALAAAGEPERFERLEGKAVLRFGGRWRKIADEALRVVLQRKLGRRVRSGSVPEVVAEEKVSRIRRPT